MTSDDFVTNKNIESLVYDIADLYKRMIKNHVFCIDIKFDNMLVHEDSDKKIKVAIIDFDSEYCSSTNSLVKFIEVSEQIRDTFPIINNEYMKKLLFYANILQLCVPISVSTSKIKILYKLLINKIPLKKIPDIIQILDIQVGNGKRILDTINFYAVPYMLESFLNGYEKMSEEVKEEYKNKWKEHNWTCVIYLVAYFGLKEAKIKTKGINILDVNYNFLKKYNF